MAGKPGRSGGARIGAGRKRQNSFVPAKKAVPRPGPCFVYVVHEVDEPSVCKIGMAFDIARRFSALQVGTWRPLRVASVTKLPSEEVAHAVEARAHRALAPLHCRGEWFQVTAERATSEVQLAAEQLQAAFDEMNLRVCDLFEV